MDELLQVPLGARRSMLFQLKEYPAEASYAVILRYIEHYHFLRDFGVESHRSRRHQSADDSVPG